MDRELKGVLLAAGITDVPASAFGDVYPPLEEVSSLFGFSGNGSFPQRSGATREQLETLRVALEQ